MKQSNFIILLSVLLNIISTKASAEHFSVKNSDGITIYYEISKDLEVSVSSFQSSSYPNDKKKYSGRIVIPESVIYEGKSYAVTTIGSYAFDGCKISSVTIPSSIISIDLYAFRYCSNLTSVHISDIAAWCKIDFRQPGLYYTNPLSYAHHLFLDGEELTDLIIPNSVTSIGQFAFINCTSFNSISIPNNLTTIGSGAFSGCTALTNVTIPDGVTSIGSGAFSGCTGMTEVSIGSNVTTIGSSAFSSCTNLTSIHIKDLAAWCNINFETPPDVGEGNVPIIPTFDSYSSNPLIYANNLILNGEKITDLVIPDGVTTISPRAFYYCSSLTSISFPASVASIGNMAFDGCTNLSSVNISDIAAWCNIVFGGKNPLSFAHSLYINGKEIKELTIPNSVTMINSYAFSGCTSISSVYIPNSITWIGDNAFENCISLTSLYLPNSVASIRSAFIGCTNLTSITIQEGATSVGGFEGLTSLTSITIPNSVTTIATYAFRNCTSLTSISIPSKVKEIGWGAFAGCTELSSINIPESVSVIESDAFSGTAWINNQPDGLVYVGKVAYQYKGDMPADTKIVLKDGTLGIAGSAFYNCVGLTSITIPNGVTTIANRAFWGCSGLTSVTIPKSLTSISADEFDNCNDLTTIVFEGEKSPNASSYEGYSNTKITLIVPVGTKATYQTSWGWKGFEKIVELGKGGLVGTKFKAKEFYCEIKDNNNLSLTSGNTKYSGHIEIPNQLTFNGKAYNITSIDESAFRNCSNLSSIVIPENVTSIGYRAFSSCDNLKYIAFTSDKFTNYKQMGSINARVIIPQSVYDKGIPNNITNFATYSNSPMYVETKSIGATSAVFELYPVDEEKGGKNSYIITTLGLTPGKNDDYLPWRLNEENYGIVSEKAKETLTLEVLAAKPLSTVKARLLAKAEEADDLTHYGFEWKRYDAPEDYPANKVSAPLYNGQIVGTLNKLKDDVYYKYRPFYESDAGEMFYGGWMTFFTGDADVYFEPEVYTKDAANITKVSALLAGVWFEGTDDIEEKGFEYWTVSNNKTRAAGSDAKKVIVSGNNNMMTTTLEGLKAGATYGFRSYAKTASGTTYGEEKTFKTILIGDANDDGELTDADVKAIACHILGNTPTVFNKKMADVNGDNKVNVADIVELNNLIGK